MDYYAIYWISSGEIFLYTQPCKHEKDTRFTKEKTMTHLGKTRCSAIAGMNLTLLLCLFVGTVMAQEPKVTELLSKDLKDSPGKEVLMITVEYPPSGSNPIHRHNAFAFVYVLEGSIVMQVKGGKQVTLAPGETWYEGPDDVHVVSRNASSTQPAKFLVFLVKNQGAPVLVPVP
jgi:quercetin dioxygenase-like cupin family protein